MDSDPPETYTVKLEPKGKFKETTEKHARTQTNTQTHRHTHTESHTAAYT